MKRAALAAALALLALPSATFAANEYVSGAALDATSSVIPSYDSPPYKYPGEVFTYTGANSSTIKYVQTKPYDATLTANCSAASIQLWTWTGSTLGSIVGAFDASSTPASPYCTYTDYTPDSMTNGQQYFIYVADNAGHPYQFYGSSTGTNEAGYINTSNVFTAGTLGLSDFYFAIADTGGVTPPITDYSTRITPVDPMGPLSGSTNVSTTSASTSVHFEADYFYASTTPATQGFYYDQVSLELNRVDAASTTERNFTIATDTPTTIDATLDLPANSAWTYFWKFSGLAPWGRIDGTYTSTQDLFILSNPLPLYIGTSTDNLTGLATSTCDILNPTGCVQNAVAFLFWPQSTTFDQFKTLQGNLRTHAPFGYLFYVLGGIQDVSGTASSTFTINIDSNIETDYFAPLRSGLAAILFALTAFWFFKRVRDLHL